MTLQFEVGASNGKSYLWWSGNLASGDLTRTDQGCNWGNKLLNTGFMCLLELFQGVGEWGAVEIAFWEDCFWDVQMQKNGVTIKRRNSL